jgi:WD40-like Beta Propeller Repeat
MLKRAALAVVSLLAVGCGTGENVTESAPVERHLVYQRVLGEKGVWIADMDGSKPRLLVANGFDPELSPDGKWVAYLSDCSDSTGECTLLLKGTTGGGSREIGRGLGSATWSPDSTRLAVVRGSVGSEALLTIDVGNGDEVMLKQGGHFYGWSFSPDGSQIVFAVTQRASFEGLYDDKVDLFVSPSDEEGAKQITDGGASGYPVWGPKSIAFAKLIPNTGKNPDELWWGRHEIWQIQPDGTGMKSISGPPPKRLLWNGFIGLVPVDWSDDGAELLGGYLNEWGAIPMAVDLETGEFHELADGLSYETVALSGDGRFALTQANSGAETPPAEEQVLILPYPEGKPIIAARGAVAPSWNR